jgi:hypothetical protein
MKKLCFFLIAVLIFIVPCLSYAQEDEKYVRKDPILAGALSWYVPGLGQFYSGAFLKGAAFLIIEEGLLITTILSVAELELSVSSGVSLGLNVTAKDDTNRNERTLAIVMGSALVVVHFVNIIDAVNSARNFNMRQENNLFANMGYDPERNEYNVGLSGRF